MTRAILCGQGIAQMQADADLALETVADEDIWRRRDPRASRGRRILDGDATTANGSCSRPSPAGSAAARRTPPRSWPGPARRARHRARGLGRRGVTPDAAGRSRSRTASTSRRPGAAVDAVSARIAVHHGATEQARADATHARRLRTLLTTGDPVDRGASPARPHPGRPRPRRRGWRADAAGGGPRDPRAVARTWGRSSTRPPTWSDASPRCAAASSARPR